MVDFFFIGGIFSLGQHQTNQTKKMKITNQISKDKVEVIRPSEYTGENHVAEVYANSNKDYSVVTVQVVTEGGHGFIFKWEIVKNVKTYEYDEDDGSIIGECLADEWISNSKNEENFKELCKTLKEENEWLNKPYIVNTHGILSHFGYQKLYSSITDAARRAIKYFDFEKNDWLNNEEREVFGKLLFDEDNHLWFVKDEIEEEND